LHTYIIEQYEPLTGSFYWLDLELQAYHEPAPLVCILDGWKLSARASLGRPGRDMGPYDMLQNMTDYSVMPDGGRYLPREVKPNSRHEKLDLEIGPETEVGCGVIHSTLQFPVFGAYSTVQQPIIRRRSHRPLPLLPYSSRCQFQIEEKTMGLRALPTMTGFEFVLYALTSVSARTVFNPASLFTNKAQTAAYFLAKCVYNIWFHPLASFPGPKWATCSPILPAYHWHSGRYPHLIKDLHETYGTIVRTAPNEWSFCSGASWKGIYYHVTGRKPFLKSAFYEPLPGETVNIVSVSDVAHHSAMRKTFSHGFSSTALSAQEDLVQGFVDLLIRQMKQNYLEKPGDVVKWYNYTTFDTIGELAFGDPFRCLASGKTTNFWEFLIQFMIIDYL
jgi:hypothetical protein